MKVIDYLEKVSADYELSEHRPTFTAQEMAAEEHVPGINVAKPVIVKADGLYYLCVLPASYKLDITALKNQIGAYSIDLIEETEMASLFPDCDLGAEPPLGSLYGLPTILDSSLDKDEYIVFQGGTHDMAIKMNMDEYKRVTDPQILKISYQS
jgi:Ala-tRNA(Pro) deacylase